MRNKKKIKKSLCLFSLLGLATTSLTLASCELPKENNVKIEQNKIQLSNATSTNISNAEINNYISNEIDVGQKFYYYDLFVNRTGNWVTERELGVIGYWNGTEVVFDGEVRMIKNLTFEAGKIYVVNGIMYNSDGTVDVACDDLTNFYSTLYDEATEKCYVYDTIDDFDCYYSTVIYPENDLEEEIAQRFSKRVAQVLPTSTLNDENLYCVGRSTIYVPRETFTVTLDDINWEEYASLELLISSADVLEPDVIAPDFEKNDYVFPSNVDNPLSLSTILSQIHAFDETDGDLSNSIKLVSTTYDPANLKLGSHDFTVSVTDNSGNIKTATFKVVVYDIVKPTFVYNVENVSYTRKATREEILNMVSFSDNFSSVTKTLNDDDYGMYENSYATLGNHTFRVIGTDEAGNSATASVVMPVIDDVAPIVSSLVKNQGCSTLLSDEEIKSLFTFSDAKSNCTIEIIDDGTYRANYNVIKDYTITVKVMDASGNSTTCTTVIRVFDDIAPSGNNAKITVSYDHLLTKEEVLALINTTDNHSEVTKTINEVDYNKYVSSYNKLGNYEISINLVDIAGNSATSSVIVTVEDKKAPIITCSAKIEAGISSKLTLDMLKSKISINDGYDGVLTNYEIVNFEKYLSKYNVVGTYEMMIVVRDSSANESRFTFQIVTKDDIEPNVFVFSDYVIVVNKGTEVTKEMILSFLGQIGEIDVLKVANVEYEMNSEVPGMYSVCVMMLDGSEYEATINVNSEITDNVIDEKKAIDNVMKFFTEKPLEATMSIIGSLLVLCGIIFILRKIFKRK